MNQEEYLKVGFKRWRPVIEEILRDNEDYASADDIYKQCSDLRALFFCNSDAFGIVQVVENPQMVTLHIILAGGSLDALFEIEEIVAKFGQEIGAKKFTFIGRKGFTKKLKSRGWTSPKMYFEKEIPYGTR